MKTLLLSFIIALFFSSIAAQTCLPEGITFTTQQQIDDFAANYPGCTEIEGDVCIGYCIWGSNANINSLTGLNQIVSIGGNLDMNDLYLSSLDDFDSLISIEGDLYIGANFSLTSIGGFESLTTIGGFLHIAFNELLTSLSGFKKLSSIGFLRIESNYFLTSLSSFENLSTIGGLRIYDNFSLTSIGGFESLSTIGGKVYIESNATLTSLDGLDGVSTIQGQLNILGNPVLTSLVGLDSLSTIGGDLIIDSNDALPSLIGLEGVSTIGGDFRIESNGALTSFTGLEGMNSMGGVLWIDGNDSLSNITGIQNIDANTIKSKYGPPDLHIKYNSLLSECEVQSICDFLVIPGVRTAIGNNAAGCNILTEIENACQMVSTSNVSPKEPIINIYPNPTSNKFTLDFSKTDINNVNITILDLSGAVQYSTMKSTNEKSIAVNLETLNPGLYLVKIHSEEYGIFYKKLMLIK